MVAIREPRWQNRALRRTVEQPDRQLCRREFQSLEYSPRGHQPTPRFASEDFSRHIQQRISRTEQHKMRSHDRVGTGGQLCQQLLKHQPSFAVFCHALVPCPVENRPDPLLQQTNAIRSIVFRAAFKSQDEPAAQFGTYDHPYCQLISISAIPARLCVTG